MFNFSAVTTISQGAGASSELVKGVSGTRATASYPAGAGAVTLGLGFGPRWEP